MSCGVQPNNTSNFPERQTGRFTLVPALLYGAIAVPLNEALCFAAERSGGRLLPPFIIEQIRKREEEEARPEHRPVIEIYIPPAPKRTNHEAEDRDRGVIVIDL